MLRNKTKKDSVDTSNSLGSDLTRSQLWLDLSESETPTGGSSPAPSPRPNLLGAGNLVAAMPHLMGTLVRFKSVLKHNTMKNDNTLEFRQFFAFLLFFSELPLQFASL